jgi:dihydrofolate synthase/folylpolyglutamate synthase
VFVPLHGAHQVDNAAVAIAAAVAMSGEPLAPDAVRDGIGAVTSPGRLEIMGTQPLILLDGAHNVAGIAALRRALATEFPDAPRTVVVGLLREKDAAEMLAALAVTGLEHLVCTRPPSARAMDPDAVADAAVALGLDEARIDVVTDVAAAVERARDVTTATGQVVVTGSLYLVGAARSVLRRA